MMTRYRRFLSTLLAIALIAALPAATYAQVAASLPDLTGGVGSSSRIALSVDDLSGENVDSVRFTIGFDADVVDLTGIDTEGTLSAGAATTVDTDTDGALTVTLVNPAPFSGAGTLVYLEAELLAEGNSDLTFDAFTFEDGTPAATTSDGSLTITAAARVQFVSASSTLDSVDVYVNGSRLINDAANPGASGFVTVPAGVALNLAVAAGDSDTEAEAVATRTEMLTAGETYVVVLTGGEGDARLALSSGVRETAMVAGDVEIIAYNATGDSLHIRTVPADSMATAGPEGFSAYLSASPSSAVFVTIGSGAAAETYLFDDVSDLEGETITIVASGSSADMRQVVSVTAEGDLIESDAYPTARVQFVHAADDAQADSIDIYVDGMLAMDDLPRNAATPFVHVAAGMEIDVAVAAGDSDSAAEALTSLQITLDEDGTYVAVLAGDDATSRPVDLYMRDDAFEMAPASNRVRFAGFHAVTGGGTFTARIGPSGFEETASYGMFTDYLDATASAYIDILVGTGDDMQVFRFTDTASLLGEAVTIVAAGASTFDLDVFAVLPDGETVAPRDFVSETARVQLIHAAADPLLDSVDVYVNDSLIVENVAYQSATPFVNVSAGIPLTVAVAPGNSDSAAEAEVSIEITLEQGNRYIGVLGGDANPGMTGAALEVFVMANAREEAAEDEMVDLLAFNGVVGSDLDITLHESDMMTVAAELGGPLALGDFSAYASVDPGSYLVNVMDSDTLDASFELDLTGMAGETLTLLASGDVEGGGALDILAVRADGTVMVTTVATDAEADAELPTAFTIDGNYPNPFNPSTTIRFDLPATATVAVEVYDMTGRRVLTRMAGSMAAGAGRTVEIDALSLASGNYVYRVVAETAADRLTQTGTMTLVK